MSTAEIAAFNSLSSGRNTAEEREKEVRAWGEVSDEGVKVDE